MWNATKYAVPFVLFCCLASGIAGACFGVRFNITPSVPIGLYRYTDRKDAPYIAVCPTGVAEQVSIERNYRPQGRGCPDGYAPMLKPVTARPGDIVTVAHHVVYVNHHLLANSRIYSQDGLKRAMPQLADGEYIVKPGTLWAVSTYNPHSFDSRYFGPISDKEVIHHVVPVLFF